MHLGHHQQGHQDVLSQGLGAALLPSHPNSCQHQALPCFPCTMTPPALWPETPLGTPSVPTKGRSRSPSRTWGWGRSTKPKPHGRTKRSRTGALTRGQGRAGHRSRRKSQLVPPFLYFYASLKKKKYIKLPSPAPATLVPATAHPGRISYKRDLSLCEPVQAGARGTSSPQGLHLQH